MSKLNSSVNHWVDTVSPIAFRARMNLSWPKSASVWDDIQQTDGEMELLDDVVVNHDAE